MALIEVAAVEYREALCAVADMLARAGSAEAVGREELRARRNQVLAVAAWAARRASARGASLSPDMETLIARIATELMDSSVAAESSPVAVAARG